MGRGNVSVLFSARKYCTCGVEFVSDVVLHLLVLCNEDKFVTCCTDVALTLFLVVMVNYEAQS